jgi:anion-transporting  ArsA/GET3 family ATPase
MTTLREATASARIVVTCGPGGVGKTTTAAALGLGLATTTSTRVLVLTIDPAKRLADALGLAGIGNDPVRVPLEGPGTLHVAMLDTVASWDNLIRRHAPSDDVAATILGNSLYQNITRRFVQSHDYVAIERVRELVDEGGFDVLIVDTPPTRHAIDFLEAPTRMADFFSSRLLRWLLAPTRGGLVGLAAKPFTQLADRILGTGFLADITEFFTALSSLHDGFVRRARDVASLLSDATTSFVVVSSLEREPLAEAAYFVDELRKRSMHVAGWITNRVLPAELAIELNDEQLERVVVEMSTSTGGVDDTQILRSFAHALADWSALAHRERTRLSSLQRHGVALFPAPSADDALRTLAGVASFGRELLATNDLESGRELS